VRTVSRSMPASELWGSELTFWKTEAARTFLKNSTVGISRPELCHQNGIKFYILGFAMFGRGRREESIISMQENVDSENKEYNEYDCMIIQTLRASTFRLRKRSYHPSNDPRGQRTIKTKKICIIIMIIYSVKFCFDIRHSKQTSMHRGEGKICHWKLESIYLQFNLKKHQVFPFP